MKIQNRICIFFLHCFFSIFISYGQSITIDARIPAADIEQGHLEMGNPGPEGKEIIANSKYLTIGGKPIIPVMGEIHYSRIPRDKWEDIILKAKANGINIIATYVFWIHHEEEEGRFDWSGNKDLRAFIELCHKHGLWAYLRLGPWCHGEVRNGGIPDWVLQKEGIKARTNDPQYQQYAERLYKEIGMHLQGLYYKDGGPIIGIQLENEYWRGAKGEEHILWLKQTAIQYGIDVPLYTVTGWRGASVPALEVIPLWGGYPTAPWTTHLNKLENNDNFTFEAPMNDPSIGHKEAGDKYQPDYTRYPYFTCELGIGNQITYHRRPVISSLDGLAIATAKTGSGSNLPGYYVFAGGSNPVGVYTTLEEDQLETGYWNEYPDISYDFQTAIHETGELAPSYHKVKLLHYFLNEFGSQLALMQPVIPGNVNSKKDLQYAVRMKDDAGFLFLMNYYRGVEKSVQKGVQFIIQLQNEKLTFPSRPVDVAPGSVFIWPFNFQMDEVLLKYATAQPLCRLDEGDHIDWFFFATEGISPELCMDGTNIKSVKQGIVEVVPQDGQYLLSYKESGLNNPVILESNSGKVQRIFIITAAEAEKFWLFYYKDDKYAFLSDANLYMDADNMLHAFGLSHSVSVTPLCPVFLKDNQNKALPGVGRGMFPSNHIELPVRNMKPEVREERLFQNAQWLAASVGKYNKQNELYHRLFYEEFELDNPADIRKASVKLFTEEPCHIRVNGKWVNQEVETGKVSIVDITGYVQMGRNTILLELPFVESKRSIIGEVDVEYYTSMRERVVTDTSWLTKVQYTIPAPWEEIRKPEKAGLASPPFVVSPDQLSIEGWRIIIDTNVLNNLENVFLRLDYSGDKARCYSGGNLVADNFNNFTTWSINLKNADIQENKLFIEIDPLPRDYRVYFDEAPNPSKIGVARIDSVWIEPEYWTEWIIYKK